MKSVILFAVLAFATAGPIEKDTVVVSLPEKVVISKIGSSYFEKKIYAQHEHEDLEEKSWSPARNYFVPEFITYQIHEAFHYEFTPEQFSTYLLKEGFPVHVAKYFVEQFEFFKNQPLENSPHYLFQYYYSHVIPEEVKHFIHEQIALSYKHFYKYFFLDEFKYPEGEYPEVSKSIAKYVMWHARYYSKHAMSSLIAQYAYSQVQYAHQYFSLIIQKLEKDVLPKEVYQYIFQQLQQCEKYFHSLSKLYDEYKSYQQYYVPYYLIQEFYHEIYGAHQLFSNVHQYINEQKEQGHWPESASEIYKYLEFVYSTIDKIYNMFDPSEYGQYFVYGENNVSSHLSENKYEQGYKGKFNFDHKHDQYPSFWYYQGEYKHIPYSETHGYHYPAYNSSWKSYGFSGFHQDLESYHPYIYHGAYQYGYPGIFSAVQSFKPHQYGYYGPHQYAYSGIHNDLESYKPHQYGYYALHNDHESYKPHQYGYHGPYQYENFGVHNDQESYKPYQYGYHGPHQYGYVGIHSDQESYKPYQYGIHGPYQYGYFGIHNDQESYKPYQYGYHGPYQYGYFGIHSDQESYKPYQYGYLGAHNDEESYKPYQYGYHGPYQYGYFGVHNDQESYKPYQHWNYNHEVYPYGYQHSAALAA